MGWDSASAGVQVSADDIAEIVSMWTGVPLMQLATEESERLLQMEDALHLRIVGQDEPIEAIARAVRRARAGLKDPKRPIGGHQCFAESNFTSAALSGDGAGVGRLRSATQRGAIRDTAKIATHHILHAVCVTA